MNRLKQLQYLPPASKSTSGSAMRGVGQDNLAQQASERLLREKI